MSLKDILGNDFAGNLSQLKDAMLQNTVVTKQNNTATGKTSGSYMSMFNELKKVNNTFVPEIKKIANQLEQAVNVLKNPPARTTTETFSSTDIVSAIDKMQKCLCERKLNEQNKSLIKAYTGFFRHHIGELKKEIAKIVMTPPIRPADRDTSINPLPADTPDDSGTKTKPSTRMSYMDDDILGRYFESTTVKFLNWMEKLRTNVDNLFFRIGKDSSLSSILLGDMGAAETSFLRDIRELAFETKGVLGDFKKAQDELLEIGQTVAITGQSRSDYQKVYQENLRAGIRDADVLKDITKQTLGYEKLLGFQVGDLTEYYQQLNNTGTVNLNQTVAMGRGMQEVQRNTGLTGKNLKQAVDASKEFVVNMTKAATMTAASANNIMSIIANAQKLGVDDAVKKLLPSITSSATLILDNSEKTQAFLYNAAGAMGRVQDLMTGTITRSKKGLKDMAAGMEKVLQGFGVRSLEEVENLTDQAKMALNIQLKASFDMELGEVTRVIKSFKESGKGLGEQLDEINKKRKLSLNLEEQNALSEQERNLKTNAALNVLTGLSEAAKGAQSMNEALNKFGNRSRDYLEDIKAFGGEAGSTTQAVESSLREAVKNLNQGLTAAGEKEIQIDSVELQKALQDKSQFDLLVQRIEQGNMRLQNAQKASVDPTLKTANTLSQYNDYFRDQYAQPLLKGLLQLVGYSGTMAVGIGLIAAQMALMTSSTFLSFGKDIKKWFKGIGKGTTPVPGPAPVPGPVPVTPPGAPAPNPVNSGLLSGITKQNLIIAGKKIAILTAGILAVGAALLVLAAMVKGFSGMQIDPIKLAVDTVSILAAAAVIMTAAGAAWIGLDKALQTYGNYFTKANLGKALLLGSALTLFATSVVGLAAGMYYAINTIMGWAGINSTNVKETTESIMLLMSGVVAITTAMALGTLMLLGIFKLATMLAIASPFALTILAGLTIVLPVLAGAFAAVGLGVIKAIDYLADIVGMPLSKINEKAWEIASLAAAIAIIVVAMAGATAAIIGVSWALKQTIAGLPFLTAFGSGVGGLVIIGLAFVALATGLAWFLEQFTEPPDDLKNGAKNASEWLDAMNTVILRILPIFGAIIGMSILLSQAQKMGTSPGLIITNALLLFGMMFALIPGLIFLSVHIYSFTEKMMEAQDPDPNKTKKMMEKFGLIMDSVNMILLKLAPIFAVIVGLGAVVALLQSQLGTVLIALAAAVVIGAVLPLIAGGITKVAVSILGFVTDITSQMPSEKSVVATTQKLDLLVWSIFQISKSLLALSGIAAISSIPLGLGVVAFVAFGVAIGLWIPAIQGAIWEISMLNSAFGTVDAKQMQDISQKIVSFELSLKSITSAIQNLITNGPKGLLKPNLSQYSTSFKAVANDIKGIVESMADITLYIDNMSSAGGIGRAAKTFEDLNKFNKSLKQLMWEFSSLKPSKKFLSAAQDFASSKGIQGAIENIFIGLKTITEVPRKAKFDRKQIYAATEVFKIVGEFGSAFGSGLGNYESSLKNLSKIKKININEDELREGVGAFVKNSIMLIETFSDYAGTKSLYNAPAAAGVLEAMTKLFNTFGVGLKAFTDAADQSQLLTQVQGFFSWWGNQKTKLEQLNQEMLVYEKDAKSGATIVKTMSTFAAAMSTMLTNFKEIVKQTTTEDFSEVVDKAGNSIKNLEKISPVMKSYSKAMTEFFDAVKDAFQEAQTSWVPFMSSDAGSGTKLAQSNTFAGRIYQANQKIVEIKNAFALTEDKELEKLPEMIKNMTGSLGKTIAELNSYAGKVGILLWNIENATEYGWMKDYDKKKDIISSIDNLIDVPARIMGVFKAGIKERGGTEPIFDKMLDDLKFWGEALSKIPALFSTAIGEVRALSVMKTITPEESQSALNNLKPVIDFAINLSKITQDLIGSIDVKTADKDALLQKMTNVTSIISAIGTTIKGFNETIYIPAISPTGMLNPQNRENLLMSSDSVKSFYDTVNEIVMKMRDMQGLTPAELKGVQERVITLDDVFKNVVKTIGYFGYHFNALAKPMEDSKGKINPSTIEQIKANAPDVLNALKTVSEFLPTLRTAVAAVPDKGNMDNMKERLEMFGAVAQSVSTVLKSINESMSMLVAPSDTDSNKNFVADLKGMVKTLHPDGGKNTLAELFRIVATEIVMPITDIQYEISKGPLVSRGNTRLLDPEDIELAAANMKNISQTMKSLTDVINVLHQFAGTKLKTGGDNAITPAINSVENDLTRLVNDLQKNESPLKSIIGQIIKVAQLFGPQSFGNLYPEDIEDAGKIFSGISAIMTTLFLGDSSIVAMMEKIGREQLGVGEKTAELAGPMPPDQQGQKLLAATPKVQAIMDNAMAMADFVNAIKVPLANMITSILKTGLYPEDVKEAAGILTGTLEIIRVLPDLIKTTNANLPDLITQVKGINDTIAKETAGMPQKGAELGLAYRNVFAFIGGLAIPLLETFGDANTVAEINGIIPHIQTLLVEMVNALPGMIQSLSDLLTMNIQAFKPEDFSNLGSIFKVTNAIGDAILSGGPLESAAKLGKATGQLNIVNDALLELAQAFHRMNGTILDLSKVSDVLKGLDGGITASVSSTSSNSFTADGNGDFGATDVHTQVQMADASSVALAGQAGIDMLVANTAEMVSLQQTTNILLASIGSGLVGTTDKISVDSSGDNPAKNARGSDGLRPLEGSKITAASNFSGRKPG